MSAEERRKILQMVADGKINAEEAAALMRSLEESAEDEIQAVETDSGLGGARSDAVEFDQVRERAKFLMWIPLWVGIILTILSAWWMFSIQQNAGLSFWFFCMSMPLVFGILLIVLGAGGGSSLWVYVNVDRSQQTDWPKNITIALPLPLGLVSWFLKKFGSQIKGLEQTWIDEALMAVSAAKSVKEPLIIHVDDGGERVQVFIG
jgi:uncharacterized integral membrane protein